MSMGSGGGLKKQTNMYLFSRLDVHSAVEKNKKSSMHDICGLDGDEAPPVDAAELLTLLHDAPVAGADAERRRRKVGSVEEEKGRLPCSDMRFIKLAGGTPFLTEVSKKKLTSACADDKIRQDRRLIPLRGNAFVTAAQQRSGQRASKC